MPKDTSVDLIPEENRDRILLNPGMATFYSTLKVFGVQSPYLESSKRIKPASSVEKRNSNTMPWIILAYTAAHFFFTSPAGKDFCDKIMSPSYQNSLESKTTELYITDRK